MWWDRRIVLALSVAFATGCGDQAHDASGPHPPRDPDERALADRYGEIVRALERNDTETFCRHLEPRLASAYGCGAGERLRIPRKIRRAEVPMAAVYAARDPSVPGVIQISSRTTRRDGYSLILFFRRQASDEWLVSRAMIGGYG